jgi:hypothetical protein
VEPTVIHQPLEQPAATVTTVMVILQMVIVNKKKQIIKISPVTKSYKGLKLEVISIFIQ